MQSSCAIYCRVSTEKQKEKHTIESQKRILPALAAANGWPVYRMYVDDGVSGEALRFMPQLSKLLEDAEAERFDRILIVDIDRFTRFARDSERALIVDICLEHHIKVVTPDQVYDLNNRNDRLQFNIKGTISLYEKETIRERCMRGIREKRLQGHWTGGTPPIPYTYNRSKKRLEIDDQKLTDLKKILTLSVDHSPREISRIIPKYTPRMIRRILEPSRLLFYTGQIQIDDQVVKANWSPIIKKNDRDRIIAAKKNRNAAGGKSTVATHLLTGLGILRCGYCDKTLKAWHDRKIRKSGKLYDRLYYRCISIHNVQGPCKDSRMMPGEKLENRILSNIDKTLAGTDILETAFRSANQSSPDMFRKLSALKKELKKERQRKKRLIKAIEEGVIQFQEAKERIQEINISIQEHQDEINNTEQNNPAWDPETIEALTNLPIRSTDFQECRLALKAYLSKIKVYSKNAYLYYRFPVMENGSHTKRIRL